MEFAGKIVLVTGASRGIGRAIALQFAEKGARVAVHYGRDRAAAEVTLSRMAGTDHALFGADVADPAAVENLVGSVVTTMGGLDVLVNNAGIFEPHPPATADYATWQAAWQHTLAVNLLGPANLCYSAAQQMMTRGGGRIVNVSSRGAFRGEPAAPAYGASKAALNSMSQSLAQALAPHGIFVAVVAPGFVETEMAKAHLQGPGGDAIRNQSPLGRVATADEVARAVVFLAAPGTEFYTGCVLDINGASYLRT